MTRYADTVLVWILIFLVNDAILGGQADEFVETCGPWDDNFVSLTLIAEEDTTSVKVFDVNETERTECQFVPLTGADGEADIPIFKLRARYRNDSDVMIGETPDTNVSCTMIETWNNQTGTQVFTLNITVYPGFINVKNSSVQLETGDERHYQLRCVVEQRTVGESPSLFPFFTHAQIGEEGDEGEEALPYEVYLIDKNDHPIETQSNNEKVRIVIESLSGDEVHGFQPVRCHLVEQSTDGAERAPVVILEKGCGTGIPFTDSAGFLMFEGRAVSEQSFTLKTIKDTYDISGEFGFSCDIISCDEGECLSNSCPSGSLDDEIELSDRNITKRRTTEFPPEFDVPIFPGEGPDGEKSDEDRLETSTNIVPLAAVAIVLAVVFIACLIVVVYLSVKRYGMYSVQR